jgi:A-macroglobulin TED domain/A-macroglobulin receptor binding domain
MAHVIEGVEAIMERPYGCGEQTISSTYPSLLLLRESRQTGQDFPRRSQAGRYLQAGYDRLLNYRDESGGFTYWGRGEPNVALTAYALRFLNEARALINVNDDVVNAACEWLVKQQRPDGSWAAYEYGNKVDDKQRTALLTSYVARVLAVSEQKAKGQKADAAKKDPQPSSSSTRVSISSALKVALDYLGQRVNEIDEPYLLASYVLAALDAGEGTRAAPVIEKLRVLAHPEGGATYWALETNTPFYGWGRAGRVETTALVVQALARSAGSQPGAVRGPRRGSAGSRAEQTNDPLIRSGLLFLLRQKDRYGVWHSTQATINVFDALLAILQKSPGAAGLQTDVAELVINGRAVQKIQLPPPNQLVAPIILNISQHLGAGNNSVELRRANSSSLASAQVAATYYVPWSASSASKDANVRVGEASSLRLLARFDKTEGKVSDEIICHVEAERVGFRGYGMLLAEIGLPPGADVDRASLETAMKRSGWAMSQYDILPDRVVVYLWPPAGGVKFDFKFRPRFGMNARTAPSTIYDYYNPDARAVVAPVLFTIR